MHYLLTTKCNHFVICVHTKLISMSDGKYANIRLTLCASTDRADFER